MGKFEFEQLAGPRKTLVLSDASAPFGRPRKDPVVRDVIEVRQHEVYYSGNDTPTRHIFGTKLGPWELHGRLRDKHLGGPGGALKKCEDIKAFVKDCQMVRVTWDDVVSVVGLVTSFDPGRESRGEVEWKMKVAVSSDDFADRKRAPVAPPRPQDYAWLMLMYLQMITTRVPRVTALRGSVLDIIDSAIGVMTGMAGAINDVAQTVSSFEKASFAQLSRLTSIVSTLRTASFTMNEAFASIGPDHALWQQRAGYNAELWDGQTSVADALRGMLAASAELDRQARATAQGRIRTTVIAQEGDTWEGLSVKFYGSADRAADLQIANDSVGSPPRAGTEVRVPA